MTMKKICVNCTKCEHFACHDFIHGHGRESSVRISIGCRVGNTALKLFADDHGLPGEECKLPYSKLDLDYGHVRPHARCPRVAAAQDSGEIMWAEFVYDARRSVIATRRWLDHVTY